jgi:hypothetical protein
MAGWRLSRVSCKLKWRSAARVGTGCSAGCNRHPKGVNGRRVVEDKLHNCLEVGESISS